MIGAKVLPLLMAVGCITGIPASKKLPRQRIESDSGNRLPRDVKPLKYSLEINALIDDAMYTGRVGVMIECQEDSDKITLHAGPDLIIPEDRVTVWKLLKESATVPQPTAQPTPAPVPIGAARLVPLSSSFVPENGCTPHSTCSGQELPQDEHEHDDEDVTVTVTADEPNGYEAHGFYEGSGSMIDLIIPPLSEATPHEAMVVSRVERNTKKQWLIIHLSQFLQRGETYSVFIEFSGQLQTQSTNGIYMETYVDLATQKEKIYVATRMQQENARKVFPCFDEPSYKVPMAITIAAPGQYSVMSNAVENAMTPRGDWTWHYFRPTPPMATFSLAFVISEIPVIASNEGSQIRLYGRSELKELPNTYEAIRITVAAYKYLEEYLQAELPFPKLDIVVLPGSHSFSESAWGLIFLRESHIICQHCIVHHMTRDVTQQWIGHLITPHSWETVDMNKALATFVAFNAELELDQTVSTNSRLWMMYYPFYYEFGKRSPSTQHSFETHPHRPIIYELVLRMFNYTFSGNVMKKGIQSLINTRSRQTYQPDDFWSGLTMMAGLNNNLPRGGTANLIANSWLIMPRVPYIKVTRDYEKHTAEVEQHSFYRDVLEDNSEPDDMLWWIPIVVVSQNYLEFGDLRPVVWMEEEKRIQISDLPSSTYFIIVNPEEVGPFLVNYDRKNWYMISEYLDRNINNLQIPSGTRAKLVHDALNLAFGGKLRFDSALNITRFLFHERDPIVWQPAFNLFDHILRQVEGTTIAAKLQEYIQIILTPAYEDLLEKTPPLSPIEERMKTSARSLLCATGYQPCVVEAREAWKIWMISDEPDAGIPIGLSHFCWVFKFGTKEEWEFGYERFKCSSPHFKEADKYYLLKSLVSCPNNSWSVENLVNATIMSPRKDDDEEIRLLLSSLSSQVGYTTLFNILEVNWETLRERHETGKSRIWENIISAATMNFKTQEGYSMVLALYERRKKKLGRLVPIFEQALRKIERQVAWYRDNGMIMEQWLDLYLRRFYGGR